MIPKTKGYTCLVKIAESALYGDTKKAKHYIKKYMIMYPDSDLIYPFTHLLAGNLNPDGLTISNSDGNYSPIAKLVWSYLKYTECDINGEHTTLIEIKEVWEMIKALEFQIHDESMRLKKLARIFKDDPELDSQMLTDLNSLIQSEKFRMPTREEAKVKADKLFGIMHRNGFWSCFDWITELNKQK